jgi:phenylacetate-CoA ligase
LSHEDLEQLQNERLASLVRHAARCVPYYQELFGRLSLHPADIRTVADLSHLPILTKQDVRHHAAGLLTEGERPYWSTETSGSTGTPLTIGLSAYAYRLSMALLECHEADHGIDRNDRRATFAGRMVQPVNDDRAPFWRYNRSERQMLCSAYHMSDRHLPAYIEALERFQPVEIIGYPSAIYALADFCRRAGRAIAIRLRAVVTNSETLFDWQRAAIETYLEAPVYDYYGTAESVVFAAQCREGRYHVEPLMGVAEVLDEEGHAVPAGAQGRLVCTTLSNPLMPLIRYEVGDSVVRSGGGCPCGRPGATWQMVIGRNDDVVVTLQGRPVGRLDHVFKGARGIREAQIAQQAPGRLAVRVVPDRDYDGGVAATIIQNTRERVGPDMQIVVQLVESIPRTSRGKFRGVVREF